MAKIYCIHCGAENDESMRFCTNCGAELDKSFMDETADAEGTEDHEVESAEPAEGESPTDEVATGPTDELEASETHVISEGEPAEEGELDGMDADLYMEERIFETAQMPSAAPSRPAPGATGPMMSQDPQPGAYSPPPAGGYPEQQPQPPAPRSNTGAVVGITVAIVMGVLVVAFGLFYFLNPFGLTTGIFADSAAAQAEAAAQAQAEAAEAQAQADEAQAQADEAQAQLEAAEEAARQQQQELEEAQQAQREAEEAREKAEQEAEEAARRRASSSSSGSSSGSSSSGPVINGIEFVHHTNPAPSSDYILPDSATRTYSKDELENLSTWELYLARNEVFARYGRKYIEDDLDSHFRSTAWYMPLYDREEFDSVDIEDYLNKHEYENVIQMRDIERARGSEYL